MEATRLVPSLAARWSGLRRAIAAIPSSRALVDRIRRSEYLTVGSSARFRAVQRTRTRAASRVGFRIIAAAAVFDGIVVFDPHLKDSAILVWLNGAVAAMALIGWKGLEGPLRRRPEPAAFVI